MRGKRLVAVSGLGVMVVAGAILWRFAFFVAPYAWTGEPARLVEELQVRPGMHVADIGAGDGSLALAVADVVGTSGRVYATELGPDRVRAIAAAAERTRRPQVHAIEGAPDATNLPPACCDGIYLRAVFHHLGNPSAFARSATQALKPRGRLAVIDFPPGTLWFHGRNHGAAPEAVVAAFRDAGLSLAKRVDEWGGGMFLLVFERRGE